MLCAAGSSEINRFLSKKLTEGVPAREAETKRNREAWDKKYNVRTKKHKKKCVLFPFSVPISVKGDFLGSDQLQEGRICTIQMSA